MQRAWQNQQVYDTNSLEWLKVRLETPFIVPVIKEDSRTQWKRAVETVALSANTGMPPDPVLEAYNKMSKAYRADQPMEFNAAVRDYQIQIAGELAPELKKMKSEQLFNFFEPFYKAMILDLCGFLLVLAYWFHPVKWNWMRRAAIGLVCLALAVHVGGLVCGWCVQGRPAGDQFVFLGDLHRFLRRVVVPGAVAGMVLGGTPSGVVVSAIMGISYR